MARGFCGLLFGLAAPVAAAQAAALSLTWAWEAEQCALHSALALPGLPPADPPGRSAWRVRGAPDPPGPSWQRDLPAPRLFDRAQDLPGFLVAVVPWPAPGTRVVLQDAAGRDRCSVRIDEALLRAASARRATHERSLQRAHAETLALAQRAPGSMLERQQRAPASSTRGQDGAQARFPWPADAQERAVAPAGASPLSHLVSGVVEGVPPYYAGFRVRAFDAQGRFVRSVAGSPFLLRVPEGVHRFEFDPDPYYRAYDDPWLHQAPVSTGPILVERETTLADFSWSAPPVELTLQVERPCGFDDSQVHLAVVAPDGRRLDRMHAQRFDLPPPVRPPGQCASEHRLWLSPGRYTIDVAPLGWAPQRLDLTLAPDTSPLTHVLTFVSIDRTAVWQGTLLDAAQQPVAGAWLQLRNADQQSLWFGHTDADGRFAAPFRPGWSIEITPPPQAAMRGSLRSLVRYGESPPASPWRLERLDLAPAPAAGLLRLLGDGDPRRLDVLLVAEGYSGVRESYSDTNGNQTWDGVVWYDLNGDRVFDGSDRVVVHGVAPYPEVGSDPTLANEPFVDLNADGLLSLDDGLRFRAEAEAFVLALFGSDVWSEHRAAFNVYLLFEPSAQAGHDVYGSDGRLALARDTTYDARVSGGYLTLDGGRLAERALLALPGVDVAVGMINTPIPSGGAFAMVGRPGLIVLGAGPWLAPPDDLLPSHEMAHLVARLCDEYTLFGGAHVLPPPDFDVGCANATAAVDPARVPWAPLLPSPSRPFPSRDRDGSLGLYEGADKFESGRYRPTRHSTMQGGFPYFNLPSRRALEAALAQHERIFGAGFED